MSQRIVRTTTPWSGPQETVRRDSLTPQLIESAATRLRWICIVCAVTTAVFLMLQRLLQPGVAGVMWQPEFSLIWLFVILASVGIGAVQRFHLLPSVAIVNLGLVFEVAVSFAISFSETAIPFPRQGPLPGVSAVAIWIVTVGLLLPNRPRTKLVVAMVSASTLPLAYFLNLHLHGFEPLPANQLLSWMYSPYLIAIITFTLAKRIYVMEVAVQKAHDLGSYHLVARIGAGGMGEVWRARHRMLARDAAIKLMRPELLVRQSGQQVEITRKRFQREARAIASLQCPHTVYLFDFGTTQDGSFYYVMELLDGISLEVLVDKFGPVPAGRVVHILRQVCESLEEAHVHGLIHRDIKPSNIFICALGLEHDFAKVLDFGLVKNLSPQEATQLTMEGVSAGTPAYMAPEIAMGESHIDGRVDLYSLGCVAYFLLTGMRVFDEKTPTATALAHVQKAPIPPSQRSEMAVPPELEKIVLSCLAKKPEDRPRSAQELGRRLEACQGVPPWTRENAAEWWQTYLPASSTHRVPRQAQSSEAVLSEDA